MGYPNKEAAAYIGTYTDSGSEGIYAVALNLSTGKLELRGVAAKLANPAYLAIAKDRKFLYAVSESESFLGEAGGAVAAFSIDCRTGRLAPVNFQSAKGNRPCHLCTDSANRFLFAANYSEGTFLEFPLHTDGSVGPVLSKIAHEGSGPNTERQEKPHAHYVTLTPEEDRLCVADLGIDKIMVYDFDRLTGSLAYNEKASVRIKPGSGPRHMEFHPSGRFAYLVNELSSDIVAFKYASSGASFTELQTLSALPEGFSGISYCAAIHLSPDGNFLYASNRGHDSIAAFSVDPDSGRLAPVSHTPTLGQYPRDFCIEPAGNFLIAANQYSDCITAFKIDRHSGTLEPAGSTLRIPAPVCVTFL